MMAEHHVDPPLRDLGDVRGKLQDVFRKPNQRRPRQAAESPSDAG